MTYSKMALTSRTSVAVSVPSNSRSCPELPPTDRACAQQTQATGAVTMLLYSCRWTWWVAVGSMASSRQTLAAAAAEQTGMLLASFEVRRGRPAWLAELDAVGMKWTF